MADLVSIGFSANQSRHVVHVDGWTPVDEQMVYASASTITVVTDATTRYQKGDKLKLSQDNGATFKYFYVIGVAATVLTVTGGSDFTVDNAIISHISVSRADRPFGFPQRFKYTPVASVPTGSIASGPTFIAGSFVVRHGLCSLQTNVRQLKTASITSNYYQLTLPIVCSAHELNPYRMCRGFSLVDQGGPTVGAFVEISTGLDKLDCYKAYNYPNWDNSVDIYQSSTCEYLI